MWVYWNRDEPREVTTVEELDELADDLDEVARSQPLPGALTLCTGPHPDGDKGYALTFVVGADTSPVQWTAPGPPYGRASWNGGVEEEPRFYTYWAGDISDLDAWMPVPIADAREAARRFLTSGGRCPENIRWETDTPAR